MAAGPQERTHTITLLAGDGIGPEVTDAVVRILEAAVEGTGAKFAWEPFLVGANAYEKYGEYIPQDVYTLDRTQPSGPKGASSHAHRRRLRIDQCSPAQEV